MIKVATANARTEVIREMENEDTNCYRVWNWHLVSDARMPLSLDIYSR